MENYDTDSIDAVLCVSGARLIKSGLLNTNITGLYSLSSSSFILNFSLSLIFGFLLNDGKRNQDLDSFLVP